MEWALILGEVILALVGTAAALSVIRTAVPWRRAPQEGWWSAYFRLYWNPGTAFVCVAYLWAATVRIGTATSDSLIYAAALGWLAVVTLVAYLDRKDLRGGVRM